MDRLPSILPLSDNLRSFFKLITSSVVMSESESDTVDLVLFGCPVPTISLSRNRLDLIVCNSACSLHGGNSQRSESWSNQTMC